MAPRLVHAQLRAAVRSLRLQFTVALAIVVACVVAVQPASAAVPTPAAYTGWGWVAQQSGGPVAAWTWHADTRTWSAASLAGGSQVYLYPFSADWRWAWTSASGWVAVPTNRTTAGDELFHTTATNGWVNSAGTAVRMNGLNVRDVGNSSWTYAQSSYELARARGFNSVRFTMNWNDFQPTSGSAFNPVALATLQTAVDRATAAGLYVILDPLHLKGGSRTNNVPAWALAGGGDSTAIVQRSGGPFLQELARRFGTNPRVIGWDLVNETQTAGSVDNARLIDAYNVLAGKVREIDPDKPVIMESMGGDARITTSDLARVTKRWNVIWSTHFYYAGGGSPNGYSSSGYVTGFQTWDGTSGYATANRPAMLAHLKATVDAARGAGFPVFVGEYGIGANAVGRDAWLRDAASVMNELGVDRAFWEWHSNGSMSATNADYTFKPFVSYVV